MKTITINGRVYTRLDLLILWLAERLALLRAERLRNVAA